MLCGGCYGELTGKDGTLTLGRRFSKRNGFGRIKRVEPVPQDFFGPIPLEQELHALLDSVTLAEEAAVKQIAILMSIVRLKHGNIGSKGSIACVRQESVLHTVLPNLPAECVTTFFSDQDKRIPGE